MKRLALALLGALALATARAEEPAAPTSAPAAATPAAPAAPAAPVSPAGPAVQRHGYAFEQPEILIRQRLFGLAHGVSMLAAACLDLPEHSTPIQDTYAAWHEKQAAAIDDIVHVLTRYHFGDKQDGAPNWQDLMRALNLKDSILPSLGNVSLRDACASLPEALGKPRYDFQALLREADRPAQAAAQPAAAPVAVAPAPTLD